MTAAIALWQLIPPSLQPFFVSGPCGFLFFGWLFFMIRNKKTAEDLEQDRWDLQKTAAMRAENDRKSARIAELEDQLSSVRRSYEATIDRIRHECEAEINIINKDRTRGWDLARAWYDAAYRMWTALVNTTLLVSVDIRPQIPEPLGRLEDRDGVPSDRPAVR